MAWDDDKSTAADPDNPAADEQLTADEWDAHVNEGHFPSDELNLGVDGGDPVFTDPQNGDEVVLRYDRSAGGWVADSISTENLSSQIYFAKSFGGGDIESRLDNAIAAASSGDEIILEDGTYSSRTISKDLCFRGTNGMTTAVECNAWTISSDFVSIDNLYITGSWDLSGQYTHLSQSIISGGVTVNANNCGITGCRGSGSVTFASGTGNGGIDACWQDITVTDNGTNSVGDI